MSCASRRSRTNCKEFASSPSPTTQSLLRTQMNDQNFEFYLPEGAQVDQVEWR